MFISCTGASGYAGDAYSAKRRGGISYFFAGGAAADRQGNTYLINAYGNLNRKAVQSLFWRIEAVYKGALLPLWVRYTGVQFPGRGSAAGSVCKWQTDCCAGNGGPFPVPEDPRFEMQYGTPCRVTFTGLCPPRLFWKDPDAAQWLFPRHLYG